MRYSSMGYNENSALFMLILNRVSRSMLCTEHERHAFQVQTKVSGLISSAILDKSSQVKGTHCDELTARQSSGKILHSAFPSEAFSITNRDT